MSVKVLCPRCRVEIPNPPDLKNITCTSCTFTFDFDSQATVISPGPGSGPPPVPGGPAPGRIGKYEILSEISRGGMGIVYKARHPELDRFVALKVIHPGLAEIPEFADRFFREAKTLAKLNHPNIVQVHDADRDGGRLYLVMELVQGKSLRAHLRERRIPPSETLRWASQICDALEAAHALGIVHRDIKPENLLVTPTGAVKVADFGLAVLFSAGPETPRLTQSNAVLGTYDYMAPEQRQGSANVDHRADLYSLGVVLYELLTGKLPVGRFEPPSAIAGTSIPLDQAIFKALEPDPERRWSRARDIRDAVSPPRPGAPPSEWKRFRGPWIAAGILCGAVLVSMWFLAWRMKGGRLAARQGHIERTSDVSAPAHLRIMPDRRLLGTTAKTLEEHFAHLAPGSTLDVELDPTSPVQRQMEVLDLAALRGVRVRFVAGDSRLIQLRLARGQRLRVEDYTIVFMELADTLLVIDRREAQCVEFIRLAKGALRRWQDLQLLVEGISPSSLSVEVELKPGAACYGAGVYYGIREGLRVDFPEGRSFSILSFDPRSSELRARFEGEQKTQERPIHPKDEGQVLGIYYRLSRNDPPDDRLRLTLDEY